MYPTNGSLPSPMVDSDMAVEYDNRHGAGDANETPLKVFIGHNLGFRVFLMSIPFRKFVELSEVANDASGEVAQRALDENHAKKLGVYMLKGLVSAAKMARIAKKLSVPPAFDNLLNSLGEQPYFSLQPIVCNIRDVAPLPMSDGVDGIRGYPVISSTNEYASHQIFLSQRHILWVVDGQHRRHAAKLALNFLDDLRSLRKYPSKGLVLASKKGESVSEDEMFVWNEAATAARGFATLTVEAHLGLNIDQERQLFHDLNRLGKKVDSSLAFQFDGSNPITLFIKNKLSGDLGVAVTSVEAKDWSQDTGAVLLKDMVGINAIAFLNKGNVSGATPAVIEPREAIVQELWGKISEIPHFGSEQAREKTIAAQPVVLKAMAKIVYDLNFSNRRPANADVLFQQFLERLPSVNFSHDNPMWNYYGLSADERLEFGLADLAEYLPEDAPGTVRDVGVKQGEFIRFSVKHNDVFPLLGDMLRWATGLPSRRLTDK